MKKAEREKLEAAKARAKEKVKEAATKKASRSRETYHGLIKKMQDEGKSEKQIKRWFVDLYRKKYEGNKEKSDIAFINGRYEVYKKLAAKIK